ncbi:MAG: transposase family protein [Pirellulaceae bacterium]|nr:transposase family protein [Pirellulaceae bacterium]
MMYGHGILWNRRRSRAQDSDGSMIDEYTRMFWRSRCHEASPAKTRLIRRAELFSMYGVPKMLRSDNGPEFMAKAIQQWLSRLSIQTLYIEPGSPWQNGVCESFNGKLRDEYLQPSELVSVADARLKSRQWQDDYNRVRPHSSLGYLTPNEFAARCADSVPLSSRHGGLLPRTSHRTGLVGPHPAPQAEHVRTA